MWRFCQLTLCGGFVGASSQQVQGKKNSINCRCQQPAGTPHVTATHHMSQPLIPGPLGTSLALTKTADFDFSIVVPPFQNTCHSSFIVPTLTKCFFLKKFCKYLKIYNNNKIYFITNLVIYKH